MGWRSLIEAVLETMWTTGILFVIVIGAFLFSYFMALTQLPKRRHRLGASARRRAWVVILMMLVFYIVLGCFLDAISMILITVPVFLPLSPWHARLRRHLVRHPVAGRGVEVGMITPPVGLNIFVIRAQMPDIALGDVFRGIVPFLGATSR